ncbi:Uncharacterized protein, UPF0548 family [Deinococcus reticulitermitis]|uniref:Uncharacterized protein, UPF0548 family n=1 Tax=Deinococcus reticulitermitis TaxID=856736 RepID=A0A1H6SKP0_9DEIO|nr:DUF1990 family protein [Deinococcus reticulitermitis]SEI64405.1 Uncharacterized protein, UPF0548 family [Deinococcus reticulitermitis]
MPRPPTASRTAPAADPAPIPFVVGPPEPGVVAQALGALPGLELALPDIGHSAHVRLELPLGRGPAAFMGGKSALWAWRSHRQGEAPAHALGPPQVGREVIGVQRSGSVTVLQGLRVMTLSDEERRWGMTLGSVSGQVYRVWEKLSVEWLPDDRVVFQVSSHHEVAPAGARLRRRGLLSPLLLAARRGTVQGYLRAMQEVRDTSED